MVPAGAPRSDDADPATDAKALTVPAGVLRSGHTSDMTGKFPESRVFLRGPSQSRAFGRERRGWTILAQLKAGSDTREIPVILCSADAGALHQRTELLERSGTRILAKPFDLDELLNLVRSALGRRSLPVGTAAAPAD